MADDLTTRFECPESRALATRPFRAAEETGGLASAAKAGRLDPGPLRPRPCPLPRPLPGSLLVSWPSPAPARRGLGGKGLVDSSGRPQSQTPRRDPSLSPSPGWATAPLPPPPRTGSVRPWPVPPAGSRRGLSRSGWRWKLVGINPGLDLPGLGGWGRPDALERAGRTTAVCMSVSRVSA